LTDKELKSLSRRELLEVLIVQMEENQKLTERLEQVEKELNDKTIRIEKSGSIAEASLRLNDIFDKAEASAALYLENIKRLEKEAEEKAEKLIRDAEEESRRMVKHAENMFNTLPKLKTIADMEEKEFVFDEKTNDKEENDKEEQENG